MMYEKVLNKYKKYAKELTSEDKKDNRRKFEKYYSTFDYILKYNVKLVQENIDYKKEK